MPVFWITATRGHCCQKQQKCPYPTSVGDRCYPEEQGWLQYSSFFFNGTSELFWNVFSICLFQQVDLEDMLLLSLCGRQQTCDKRETCLITEGKSSSTSLSLVHSALEQVPLCMIPNHFCPTAKVVTYIHTHTQTYIYTCRYTYVPLWEVLPFKS